MKDKKNRLLAEDKWLASQPDDVYDPCPCGCGKKFRYVVRDEKAYFEHMEVFIKNWLDETAKVQ